MKAHASARAAALICSMTLLAGCGAGTTPRATSAIPITPGAVFLADKSIDGVTELYVADVNAGPPRKLSGSLVTGGAVSSFSISPGGLFVAYLADAGIDGTNELYVVSASGGDVRKVSGTLISGGDVSNYRWAPDASRLLYSATKDSATLIELYSVRPDGSGSVKVSGPQPVGGGVHVSEFDWSPDSSRIAYVAQQTTVGVLELYTVFPDGTGNVKVSGPQIAGGDVGAGTVVDPDEEEPQLLAWAPDSSRIAYIADQTTDGVAELYTSLPDGTAGNVKVSGALVSGGNVDLGFEWAPDSSVIAYTADRSTDEITELYVAAPDGSATTKVSGVLVATGEVAGFRWSPDSSRLAYLADQAVADVNELYVATPTGGAVRVSGAQVAGGDVQANFEWSPDSSRIAYVADQATNDLFELYTVTPDGSSNPKVSGSLVSGGGLSASPEPFLWAPNGSRLAFVADRVINDTFELFVVEPAGANLLKVSGAMVSGGSVPAGATAGTSMLWSPDSTRLFYRADQDVNDTFELYSVGADGGARRKASGSLISGGDVTDFSIVE